MASGLRRFVGRSQVEFAQRAPEPVGGRCEMCGVTIADEHPHVVNLERRSLLCTCRPCYLLFTPDGAGAGHYRAVPDRYLIDPLGGLSAAQWDALQLPIGMAFFFHNSVLDSVVAQYPGPAGAVESLLDLDAWREIVETNRLAASLVPDVEALIVRRERDHDDVFLVPIDACYELVGRLRMHWTGFDGGPEARTVIDAFFDHVRNLSTSVEAADA
jgi:hypothetical protein